MTGRDTAACNRARWMKLWLHLLVNRGKERFECPVCGFSGPFRDVRAATGRRRHAQCPSCNALERHRIQYLVMDRLMKERQPAAMRVLHVAPESFFTAWFKRRFSSYVTADIGMSGVDYQVDLRALPFEDGSFDLVFASHVLEHVSEDRRAIAEIRRMLPPGGIAVLPVPLVVEKTIEYPGPNPLESGHVRAPGLDYFDRFAAYFSRVEMITSDMLPARYQLYVYEDRSGWPAPDSPLRTPMAGERHADIVPVCYA